MRNFIGRHMMTIALVVSLAVLVFVVYLSGTSDAAQNDIELAWQVVATQGYTDIQYIDKNSSACGYDEKAGFEFEATMNDMRGRVVACPMPRGYFRIVVKGQ